MEFVEGETLSKIIERGPIALDKALILHPRLDNSNGVGKRLFGGPSGLLLPTALSLSRLRCWSTALELRRPAAGVVQAPDRLESREQNIFAGNGQEVDLSRERSQKGSPLPA